MFRLGDYIIEPYGDIVNYLRLYVVDFTKAVHIGRAFLDGRFSDLELRNLDVPVGKIDDTFLLTGLLDHAQSFYGPDAQPLLPLPDAQADPDLDGRAGPSSAGWGRSPPSPRGQKAIQPDNSAHLRLGGAIEQNVGPLLNAASVPFRVVGPDADLAFDPTSYFFYQDSRRCYYVESVRYTSGAVPGCPPALEPRHGTVRGALLLPPLLPPVHPAVLARLAGGGFPYLYDRNLQLNPDTIDPSHADVFSFQGTYQPFTPRVSWGEDNEIIDFSPDAAYSVYNWELFFHAPLYIAERLSQNQQFEDALKWFHFIFDPTRQGPDWCRSGSGSPNRSTA